MTVIGSSRRKEADDRSVVSVLVDRAASPSAVRAAVARLTVPPGVDVITVDDSADTVVFDCRIVVDLTGTFGRGAGTAIARAYASALTNVLGIPALCLADLLLANLLFANPARTLASDDGP